jgi:predicted peptidase
MGGFGTWQTAITYPNKFAGLVSVAGGIESTGRVSDADKAILSPQAAAAVNSSDPYRSYAQALVKLPVWIVHGSADNVVPVDGSRKIAAALKTAGNSDVNYKELEGNDHGSVGHAFSDPFLAEWLSKRQLAPSK